MDSSEVGRISLSHIKWTQRRVTEELKTNEESLEKLKTNEESLEDTPIQLTALP